LLRYVVHRIFVMIPTVIAISVVTFVIINLPPGDFLSAQISELQAQGEGVQFERIEYLRELYGLDRPLWERYFHWVWGMLHGDLGWSFEYDRPVTRSDRRQDLLAYGRHLALGTVLFTWIGRLPDRYLLGHVYKYSMGRPRPDLFGLPGPRDAEFPFGADDALPVAKVYFGTDHRRADGAAVSSVSR
jgi:peptide/nickel transport system permease protein